MPSVWTVSFIIIFCRLPLVQFRVVVIICCILFSFISMCHISMFGHWKKESVFFLHDRLLVRFGYVPLVRFTLLGNRLCRIFPFLGRSPVENPCTFKCTLIKYAIFDYCFFHSPSLLANGINSECCTSNETICFSAFRHFQRVSDTFACHFPAFISNFSIWISSWTFQPLCFERRKVKFCIWHSLLRWIWKFQIASK